MNSNNQTSNRADSLDLPDINQRRQLQRRVEKIKTLALRDDCLRRQSSNNLLRRNIFGCSEYFHEKIQLEHQKA